MHTAHHAQPIYFHVGGAPTIQDHKPWGPTWMSPDPTGFAPIRMDLTVGSKSQKKKKKKKETIFIRPLNLSTPYEGARMILWATNFAKRWGPSKTS